MSDHHSSIRPYRRGDRDAILALSLRAWEPVFASLAEVLAGSDVFERLHPDWRASQIEAVDAALDDESTTTSVAIVPPSPERRSTEAGDVVAGFVAVRARPDASLGEIHMLAVDPAHQRRGIAAALTAHALAWMTDRGLRTATVETGGDRGHGPARRTYVAAGFTALPVVRYFRAL